MAEIEVRAETGRPVGSAAARRLRREGKVPAVVYGHGVEGVPVAVAARDLRAAFATAAGLNAVLTLDLDGRRYMALARELQRHPVRGTLLHVDFQVVNPDERVTAEVPVTLVGEALEVAHADGVVDQELFTLPVTATPGGLPPAIEVDISGLSVGGVIRVADLRLPPGASCELDPDTVVVTGGAGTQAEAAEAETTEASDQG
jgi:large subunit ribosomal protein L25